MTAARAVRITIVDLGGVLHLDEVGRVLGHVPEVAPLVRGAGPSFGPFGAPLAIAFQHEGYDVELVIHSVGAVAYRVSCPVEEPWEPVQLPDPVALWGQAVTQALEPALHDRYDALAGAEVWDLRLLAGPVDDTAQAEAFVAGLGTHRGDGTPVTLRRAGGAVMLGRDRAVIWGPSADVLDVLELARAELLEFRAYDGYLDDRLDESFDALDRLWSRRGLFRSARSMLRELSHVRVEIARLTDPLYATGKAFGDRFTERLHRAAHERLRLSAWQQAVAHKTQVLEDMFHLAQEEANHRRALVLETMIVLLFILDLLLLLGIGK